MMSPLNSAGQSREFYLGRRLSYEGVLCTVRYHGTLSDTEGVWLGVEWDDVTRGKHDGAHHGVQYFSCLSAAATAASFLRPTRMYDDARSFLDALRFKYAGEQPKVSKTGIAEKQADDTTANINAIEISGKVVEEVGFDRIRRQQAVLKDLRIVLLDELCLAGIAVERTDLANIAAAQEAISRTCPDIKELELGWSLIETWADIAAICAPLKKLQILKASGVRFRCFDLSPAVERERPFQHVVELHLNEDLLRINEILPLLISPKSHSQQFPMLKVLSLGQNSLSSFPPAIGHHPDHQLVTVETLILENNLFDSLACLRDIVTVFPNLKALSLQRNQIAHIGLSVPADACDAALCFPLLETLNLSQNLIADYFFVDTISLLFPNLTSLRVSNNPLFTQTMSELSAGLGVRHDETLTMASATNRQAGRGSVRSDAAFSLTLARIPTLVILNHSSISPRDREEGEIYYTSLAEKDLSISAAKLAVDGVNRESVVKEQRRKYPRYEELCRKYDRDSVFEAFLLQQGNFASTSKTQGASGQVTYASGTLGARLIKATFYIYRPSPTSSATPPQPIIRLIPRTIDVYRLKALVARVFALPALQFKLTYESEELDPVKDEGYESATWDTWGDWDLDHPPAEEGDQMAKEGSKWRKREVEIVDGTREWGFYVEDEVREVSVRVEPFVGRKS